MSIVTLGIAAAVAFAVAMLMGHLTGWRDPEG